MDLQQNIANHLTTIAKEQPYLNAVFFPHSKDASDHVAYTHFNYMQLDNESTLIANGLKNYGITKGTRTVLMVKPSLDFFALAFALFKVGAIPIMIDPGMGLKNVKQCLKEAKPEAFIGIPAARIARVLFGWERNKIKKFVTVGNSTLFKGTSLEKLKDLGKKNLDKFTNSIPSKNDQAAILFTSGSTGSPKGAIYKHQNFNAQIKIFKEIYKIKPGEIDLCTFPLFTLFAPALGMTAVIPDMDFTKPAEVDPCKIFKALESFGVTNMFGSPALLKTLSLSKEIENKKFPTLKRIISAGAPVPHTTLSKISEILPDNAYIHTPYGATESLPVCTISSKEILSETRDLTKEGKGICIGRPVPLIQLEIIVTTDDPIKEWSDDLIVKENTIGEITVRGPQVTESYFNRPEADNKGKILDPKTNEVIHRMGDLGYKDNLGRIWFCGRKAHRVITKNETLYTIPNEEIFNQHPKVNRTALVGAELNGEVTPILCVETTNKEQKQTLDKIKKDLLSTASMNQNTQNIKTVLFHESFPVDIRHNSKIFREKLKPWAEGKLQ